MRTLGPIVLVLVGCGETAQPLEPRVLVYSRTVGFRHADAIAAGTPALQARLTEDGITSDVTEDPAAFASLTDYGAVIFLYTSGNDVLDEPGKLELERFVRAGGGWMGVHSAADTEYLWPFYQEMLLAPFADHPPIQEAAVDIVDRDHPATALAPERWVAADEWYNFAVNPRADDVRVLATLDEASYTGGTMGDHPIIWAHERLGGRVLYSELGHVAERWSEPAFVEHVAGAIRWILHRE